MLVCFVSDCYETESNAESEVDPALRLHNAVGTSHIIIIVLYVSGAHGARRGKSVQGRVLLTALGRP
jgi:hypothetical protein